ncbi:nucleotidyl transferase AbiEii/AbiGii toxin family protein [Haloquadratum walsbyi]|uniref:nucleotidyl transferase AbiEii/AbiGii toxin family protein n=1 Tax=Haloquadratum walsbyi TaxID=293091 RepID=UPI000323BC8D
MDHEHAFEDFPTFSLAAYSIEEILVEKLRSLFQRTRARDYTMFMGCWNRNRSTTRRLSLPYGRKYAPTM